MGVGQFGRIPPLDMSVFTQRVQRQGLCGYVRSTVEVGQVLPLAILYKFPHFQSLFDLVLVGQISVLLARFQVGISSRARLRTLEQTSHATLKVVARIESALGPAATTCTHDGSGYSLPRRCSSLYRAITLSLVAFPAISVAEKVKADQSFSQKHADHASRRTDPFHRTTMSTPHYVPLPPPQPKADSVVLTLSEKQEQQLKEVLDHFTKPEYLLPEVEKGELSEEEKFWLSHECLLR